MNDWFTFQKPVKVLMKPDLPLPTVNGLEKKNEGVNLYKVQVNRKQKEVKTSRWSSLTLDVISVS